MRVAAFEGATRKRGRQTPRFRLRLKRGYTLAPSARGLFVVALAKSEARASLLIQFSSCLCGGGTRPPGGFCNVSLQPARPEVALHLDPVHLVCAVTGSARFIVPPLSSGWDQAV